MTRHSFVSTLMRYTVSLEYIEHEEKLTLAVVVPNNITMNISVLHALFDNAQIEVNDDGSRSFSGCVKNKYFQQAFLEEYYLHGVTT